MTSYKFNLLSILVVLLKQSVLVQRIFCVILAQSYIAVVIDITYRAGMSIQDWLYGLVGLVF